MLRDRSGCSFFGRKDLEQQRQNRTKGDKSFSFHRFIPDSYPINTKQHTNLPLKPFIPASSSQVQQLSGFLWIIPPQLHLLFELTAEMFLRCWQTCLPSAAFSTSFSDLWLSAGSSPPKTSTVHFHTFMGGLLGQLAG